MTVVGAECGIMATSKVRNTKTSFNTGKNEKAESMLRRAFEPLFSAKDNKARLTFCGVQHSYNNQKNRKTGKNEEVPKLVLVFSCLDVTHEAPQNIGVRVDYRVSKSNALGRFLTLLGYQFKDIITVIDEDDEFGTKTKYDDSLNVFDYLRDKCGLVFKGELKKATATNKDGQKYEKGLWNIITPSLEPLMKNGEQLRDMMASDISDEDFENPDIAMTGEGE